jgi:hypothetical protein
MICEQHRCIFVHIPKAAGQSIEQFFMQRRGLVWGADQAALYLHDNDDPSKGTEKLSHLSATEYVDCGHISADDYSSYFKFSFVRNPWSRLLSEYLYRNYFHHRSFKHFVLEKQPKPGCSDKYRHVMPQYDMLHDSNGKLLVDYVGRFENLQADFSKVCKRLGITDSALPHRNSSEKESRVRKRRIRNTILRNGENCKKTLDDFYDLELREAVAEMYWRDIESFGYQFPEALGEEASPFMALGAEQTASLPA